MVEPLYTFFKNWKWSKIYQNRFLKINFFLRRELERENTRIQKFKKAEYVKQLYPKIELFKNPKVQICKVEIYKKIYATLYITGYPLNNIHN